MGVMGGPPAVTDRLGTVLLTAHIVFSSSPLTGPEPRSEQSSQIKHRTYRGSRFGGW